MYIHDCIYCCLTGGFNSEIPSLGSLAQDRLDDPGPTLAWPEGAEGHWGMTTQRPTREGREGG